MPVFTAAAVYIAGAIGVTSALGVAAINLGVRLVTTAVVSSLIGNKQDPGSRSTAGTAAAAAGSRIQLSPSTDNKLGVVYGSAFVSPIIVDAKISTDQKTMWYVLALTEVTDTGTLTLGDYTSLTNSNIFWGDKQLVFDVADTTKVVKWINSDGQEDTKCNGSLYVYLYNNGVNGGVNTQLSAVNVLSDESIPAEQRYNGSKYTFTGSSPTFYKTAFMIVKIIYNQDAGITQLDQIRVKATNTLTKPGTVIKDYLNNDRYGCAVPLTQIDTASLDALDLYSDELISYTPVGGGTAYQPRYRINGPLNTDVSCLDNLQLLVDSCDSWLQWNESIAKWSVIPNRSYLDYTTYAGLFVINESNIISGVNISPIDLNSAYNIIETTFPNAKIKDQTDYNFVYLDPQDKNPNEPINKLSVQYPLINSSVTAQYLATRRLIQSREDLVVDFSMDYSGIQIDAGDVVRVRHPTYGWGPYPGAPTNPDKLFRVNQVLESKADDGSLGVRLSLMEYNEQVYQNISITDYQPAANTGLTDPTILPKPIAPTITEPNTTENNFKVQATVPNSGSIIAIEFWYGPTATIENNNYKLWDTQYYSSGPLYPIGATETTDVVGFGGGTYYWAVRMLTQTTKSSFSDSTQQIWTPANLPEQKVVSNPDSTTVTYANTYKLWGDNTRGIVLTNDYTPTENGSDLGGLAQNLINLNFSVSAYSANFTDGLCAEIYSSMNYFRYKITEMIKGTNGIVIVTENAIWYTGLITSTANPLDNPQFSPIQQVVTAPSGVTFLGGATDGTSFIVVGNQGKVYRSANGYTNWTLATTPAPNSYTLEKATYGGGYFVAVGGIANYSSATGGTAYVMVSPDGVTWTQIGDIASTNQLTCVGYNGTRYVATGVALITFESTDGLNWTYSYIPGGSTINATQIKWNSTNSLWFMTANNTSTNTSRIYTDVSNLSGGWQARYVGSLSGTQLTDIALHSNNVGFAVGKLGEIVVSTNGGLNWQVVTSNFIGNYSVCLNDGQYFYLMGDQTLGMADGSAPAFKIDSSTTPTFTLEPIYLWETIRIFAYGSSPSALPANLGQYDNTVVAVQDRLPVNTPVSLLYRFGTYRQNVPIKFQLVVGNLNNPTNPTITYASRRILAIAEFKG